MLHRRDGTRFPPDVMLGIQAKEFNHGFIRPENLVSHGLRVFRCLLANSKRAVMCLLLRSCFRLATLPYRPDWGSSAEMVVLLEGSPISTEELCWSDHWVVGHLADQVPSPPVAQFGQAASSRNSVGGSKLLNLRIMESTVFLGAFTAA